MGGEKPCADLAADIIRPATRLLKAPGACQLSGRPPPDIHIQSSIQKESHIFKMKFAAILTKHAQKAWCAAVALGAALAPASALAVTTWNWSYSTDISDQFASGTFTTADVAPAANTTYQITSISGTYNRGGTAYTITGLNTEEANQFRWDGTSSSKIIAESLKLIGFTVSDGTVYLTNTNSLGFSFANRTFTTLPGNDSFNITSSLLSPVGAPPLRFLAPCPCSVLPQPSRPAGASVVV